MAKYESMSTEQKLSSLGLKECSEDYEKAEQSLESGASAGVGDLEKFGFSKPKSKRVPFPSELKKGGKVSSSASKRADGCAQRGKTKGKMV